MWIAHLVRKLMLEPVYPQFAPEVISESLHREGAQSFPEETELIQVTGDHAAGGLSEWPKETQVRPSF